MRLIIAGGRDYTKLTQAFGLLEPFERKVSRVVCGCAKGADAVGREWAVYHRIPVDEFPANWDLYGRSAGYRRNGQMAENADALVAFWNGESKGTRHMIDIARKRGLSVTVFLYDTDELI